VNNWSYCWLKGMTDDFHFHVHILLFREYGTVYAEEPRFLSKAMFHHVRGSIGSPRVVQRAQLAVNITVLKVVTVVSCSLYAALYINRLQCL
jgi:hypothetical protein